jgi:glucose-1-phosphate thymidylyltransferase
MKSVILHGGQGIRLRPITHTGPKQLINVAGKPISQWGLEKLVDAGITEIAIILGENNPTKVVEYYGNGSKFGAHITYIYQGKARGIAEAVNRVKDFVKDEKFIVFLGDNVILDDLDKLLCEDCDASILLARVKNPEHFGVAVLDGDKIIKLVEKPKQYISDYAVVGVYMFNHEIFDCIDSLKPSARSELEITEAIQILIDRGKIVKYSIINSWWKDTGNPEYLLETNMKLLDSYVKEENNGQIENSTILGRVFIGKNTKITNSKIIGPTYIGDNVEIENSIINAYSSINNFTKIKMSQISYSLILENCNLENIEISDSIIGKNSSLKKMTEELGNSKFIIGENTDIMVR